MGRFRKTSWIFLAAQMAPGMAVGSGADSDAGLSQVGEHQRPQIRILAKEVFGSHSLRFCRRTGVARNCNKQRNAKSVVNPRRACAARVTVVGSVSVCPCFNSPLDCLFVPQTIPSTARVTTISLI